MGLLTNPLKELTNTALLSYLEDVACIHSEIAGYGITNMYTIKKTWILLSWKIKVIERPKFSDNLKVKTWSRLIDKFYAYRDFEVYNAKGDLIAIASSKWVPRLEVKLDACSLYSLIRKSLNPSCPISDNITEEEL